MYAKELKPNMKIEFDYLTNGRKDHYIKQIENVNDTFFESSGGGRFFYVYMRNCIAIQETSKKINNEKPTTKPDGTRICSWRSGKRHYGFFHLFGETTVRTRTDYDVKEIRALVETLDGTMIWLDPMRIKFED